MPQASSNERGGGLSPCGMFFGEPGNENYLGPQPIQPGKSIIPGISLACVRSRSHGHGPVPLGVPRPTIHPERESDQRPKLTRPAPFNRVTLPQQLQIPPGKRHSMIPQPIPRFPHRHNCNGSHDSICTRCQLTVASVRNETDLALYEFDHTCSPIRLYDLSADLLHTRTSLSL
jgi:hypothetical protein